MAQDREFWRGLEPHFIARITRCAVQSLGRLPLGRHMHMAGDEWIGQVSRVLTLHSCIPSRSHGFVNFHAGTHRKHLPQLLTELRTSMRTATRGAKNEQLRMPAIYVTHTGCEFATGGRRARARRARAIDYGRVRSTTSRVATPQRRALGPVKPALQPRHRRIHDHGHRPERLWLRCPPCSAG